ncbi:unnamed protein product [Brachionus calyciflorus]|uniref:Glycosyltransferase 61 catalytic domain-containing protein n=1 Tax=Brachionus calyciflorus TaxID=104777 RepID=A0A814HWX4_9BILA|nr:unnamed protein product [Brachionus calyciflorus]
MFTGPKEAIEFRKRLSTEMNIFYERSRVVIVKRKNRLIVNQNELEEFLKQKFGEYNVDVVYFEELSFIQQVEKVTKAKLLIGVHGAGLTNSIFLPTLSTVIEITPPHFHYPLYERISIQSGHIFFRFVTQYHPSIHQNNSYLNVNSIDCSYNISCLVFWRESPIFVNITKFSVIIEQAMETF